MSAEELEAALRLAKELMKIGPQIVGFMEDLAELRRRQGRDAEAGDLDDTVKKLRALDRRKG